VHGRGGRGYGVANLGFSTGKLIIMNGYKTLRNDYFIFTFRTDVIFVTYY